MDSPAGRLLIAENKSALVRISFSREQPQAEWRKVSKLRLDAIQQLSEYFNKKRAEFELPLEPDGTEFQKLVWNHLCKIGYGQTISYLELANSIGKPKAIRAVGAANGQNPIPIIIPCHRVIGSNGSLVGYGGGLEIKKLLLALENRQADLKF